MDQDITDQMMIAALRKRMLGELGGQGAERIVNNVYGNHQGADGSAGGLMGQMAGTGGGEGGMSPQDMDYFVDIMREDLPEVNPLTGKPKGWQKKVHRFAVPKKKVMEEEV